MNYDVTGSARTTGESVTIRIDAADESDARAKAEALAVLVHDVRPASDAPPRSRGTMAFSILGWLCVAAALLAALGAWGSARPRAIEDLLAGRNIPLGIGFLFGMNILSWIALALGGVVAVRSERRKGRALRVLAILCIVATVGGVLRPRPPVQTRQQAQKAMGDLARIMDKAIPAPGSAPAAAPEVIASSEDHGSMAPMIRAFQQLSEGIMQDAQLYQARVIALRIDSVLLPNRLDSVEEIRDSRRIIDTAQGHLTEYKTAVDGRLKAVRDSLRAAYGEAMIPSFESGAARSMPKVQRILFYEDEMYREMSELLAFMESRQGKVTIKDGAPIFTETDDADTYNASIDRFNGIAFRQSSARDELMEVSRANVERMKTAAANGDPVTPTPTLTAKHSTSVTLLADAFEVAGHRFTFPLTITQLEAVLGAADRVTKVANTVHTWDRRGLFALVRPGQADVVELTISLSGKQPADYMPRQACEGQLELVGSRISDVDTPRSLNRVLKDRSFTLVSRDHGWWRLDLTGYSVGMSMGVDGLTDTIEIFLPEPEAADEAAPVETGKPRF